VIDTFTRLSLLRFSSKGEDSRRDAHLDGVKETRTEHLKSNNVWFQQLRDHLRVAIPKTAKGTIAEDAQAC